MLPSLPPEILNLILDHLRDEPTALKTCCVVSKPWSHQTRKYLFARVEFHPSKAHIELWKKTFPDPSKSPAHHTRSLSIYGLSVITTADGGVGGWIRSFHNLVHLHLGRVSWEDHRVSLVPFHGLSPTLRSLYLSSTSREILDLICSFPLLEDLALVALRGGGAADVWNTPSTSPKLTGSLSILGGIAPAVCRLVGLPNGLNFTEISVGHPGEDVKWMTDLVSKCSDTLESFSIYCCTPGRSATSPLDLSTATRLKRLSFRIRWEGAQQITMALQTVQSENLQQITINPYGIFASKIGGKVRQEWQELDRLLLQFWTSHSTRPRIKYNAGNVGDDDLGVLAPSLFPELTRRGAVDLIKG